MTHDNEVPVEPSRINWDYFAGFFDGEGSVTIQVNRSLTHGFGWSLTPNLSMSQKRREVLDNIHVFIGQPSFVCKSHGDRAWKLLVQNLALLARIQTGLVGRTVVKRRQLELLGDFLRIKYKRGLDLEKEHVLKLLVIGAEISLASSKPSPIYQEKVKLAIHEVSASTWSPLQHRMLTRYNRHKLSWEQVNEIRTRVANGEQHFAQMGREYGVCGETIWSIAHGRTWQLETRTNRPITD